MKVTASRCLSLKSMRALGMVLMFMFMGVEQGAAADGVIEYKGAHQLIIENETPYYVWVKNVETEGKAHQVGYRYVYKDITNFNGIKPGGTETWKAYDLHNVLVGSPHQDEAYFYISKTEKFEDAKGPKMYRIQETFSVHESAQEPNDWQPFGPGSTIKFKIKNSEGLMGNPIPMTHSHLKSTVTITEEKTGS